MKFESIYPDYPEYAMKESINGKEITIIGVQHTPEFLNSHKSFFEDRVAESDVMVLEQSIGGEFWESPFFGAVGKIAHSKQKRIYQIDPLTMQSGLIDIFGIPTICISGIVHELRNEKTDRRKFLKKIGKIGVYSYLLSGTFPAKMSIIYGSEDIYSYGLTDYRNVMIADGIERLSRQTDGIRKIVSIHGNAHADTVRGYIKDSEIREIKKNLYLPYDNKVLSKTKIREYVPDENRWRLTREF